MRPRGHTARRYARRVNDSRDAIVARFDSRASEYDGSAMHRALAEAVAAFVRLDGVDTVLDVATGTGLVLRALRPDHPVRMVGVDLSPGMLAVARAALPGAELVVADATALPLADGSVDLVTCSTALHLIEAPDAAFAEWVRVLRPGGRVVTATFGLGTDLAAHSHSDAPPPYPVHPERFRTAELVGAAAAGSGLVVTRHQDWTHGDESVVIVELAPAARGHGATAMGRRPPPAGRASPAGRAPG